MTDSTRRDFLLGSMALGPLAACGGQRGDAGAKPPNIILCMSDDQGWGDTGYNGHPYLKTPHLDAMSRAGLRFDRFYSGAPVCSPTRGSALTGRHPYRYGVPTANSGHIRDGEITLAELLKAQGYTTGHFGKWHLGTLTNDQEDGRRGGRRPEHYAPPWEHGFDQSFSAEVQMPTWNPMENQAFASKYWTGEGEYATENLSGDDSRVIMDRAIPFIQQAVAERTPFFAVIWFHAPHRPVVAGPEHRALYAGFSEGEQHYYGCITALDEQVGRLRAELRDLGVADDTMLWYCSDNGPEGRTSHRQTDRGSSGGLRGRKRSLFEGGVRVPGILEWPSRVEAGGVSDMPASTCDYFPTIASALGLDAPEDGRPIDGVSLLPLIDGDMEQRGRPIAFQCPDGGEGGQSARLGSPDHALIGDRYKLLSFLDDERSGEDMLFDIALDPGERHDLAGELPEVATQMKQYLLDWDASCARSDEGADYSSG
ncbi:MAG: sulfatase-like hydrolase/transferase [Bryobacterales bacterium]|nr:sulfatase-like hydrolase/transferase [Bryobacterales bacterium]MDE0621493.1 sulfatase-like hydrolase/transferase [Bryobacterales bacterium]